jgi:hypothetical protein
MKGNCKGNINAKEGKIKSTGCVRSIFSIARERKYIYIFFLGGGVEKLLGGGVGGLRVLCSRSLPLLGGGGGAARPGWEQGKG